MPKNARAYLAFASICVIFVAARFWRLDESCLWFDEMFSVQAAELPWSEMFRFLALDLVHPPLFYMFLKAWIGIGGSDPFWLRTLPVIFGCLSIAPFVLLCRELKQSRFVTLLALFLLAVNGSLIKYAQEVRMYTLLMLVSIASLWLFARYFYRGKGLAALLVVDVLAVYVHYYAWAFVGCEVIAVLVFRRQRLLPILGMAGGVLAAFAPWLFVVASNAQRSRLDENIAWIHRPGFRVLLDYVFDLIEPFYFQTSSAEPSSIFAVTVPMLLVILAAVAWGVSANRDDDEGGHRAVAILPIFSGLILIFVFAASWLLPYSVWGTRHLIIIVAPAMLLVANAFRSIPSQGFRIAGIALLAMISASAGVLALKRDAPQNVWCGWEPLVAGVESPDGAPVELYASENLAAYHTWFAARGTDRLNVHLVKAPEGEFVDPEYFPPRGFNGIRQTDLAEINVPRLVVIYRREKPVLTDWLRVRLEAQGYEACTPQSKVFGRSTIVRVEMRRGAEGCLY